MTLEQYHATLHALLGGQEAPLIDGQRHILSRCPRCQCTWVQRGPSQDLHLSQDDLAAWATRLHADLAHLPARTCRPCQIRALGGEFALDEYIDASSGAITGYGASWEQALPAEHFLVIGVLADWLARQDTIPVPSVVTSPALARTVLLTLMELSAPQVQPLPSLMRALLTGSTPAGAHAPGTEGWTWNGGIGSIACPALGGSLCVLLTQAGPPRAPFSRADALARWRQITRHALHVGLG